MPWVPMRNKSATNQKVRPLSRRELADRAPAGGNYAYRSQPIAKSPSFDAKLRLTAVAVGLAFAIIALRVGYLTVIRGEHYAAAARDNPLAHRRLEAPRGNIVDRNGRVVATNRKAYALTFSRYGLSPQATYSTLQRLGDLTGEDLAARYDEIMETRPSWTRHRLARRLPLDVVVPVMERPDDFPGVRAASDFRREYPAGPALAPVIGYLGKIPPESVETYTRPVYLPDSEVGRAGLERLYEERLVGRPGTERRTLNARGRLLSDPEILRPARPGWDMVLTLDAELQAAAFDLLRDRKGAIIAMDARTGGLLALASAPSFDPERPWRGDAEGRDPSYLNRATRGTYPPGSTFKPVVALAMMAGGWNPHERIRCTGSVTAPGWGIVFRCNNHAGHGALDLGESIKHSCNVYFYEAAMRGGAGGFLAQARALGFGEPTGIDLPGERAGSVPAADPGARSGEALNLSIGQGALLVTPLQVARAYATLANGGTAVVPHVVAGWRHPDSGRTETAPVPDAPRVGLAPRDRAEVVNAMHGVANEPGGTAYSAGFDPSWQVCGKTGTAENGRGGIDAWFAGFYPRSAPETVIIVVVEDADGHGGEVAAPMARSLIARLESAVPALPVTTAVAANH